MNQNPTGTWKQATVTSEQGQVTAKHPIFTSRFVFSTHGAILSNTQEVIKALFLTV